ncbi:MAG: 2OG-Fe(II) oxygenase [Proteobacteria bacterium]|nr:MAG: 2OG-Fe(II) oxygenase [Pseudomonadota bacterium]PIE40171.1 MAG: 2OG-Fe(II) oxygenase [Gammaproteobacteria bacterium]
MTCNTENEPNAVLFESIARDLMEKGYSINPQALPVSLASALRECLDRMEEQSYSSAGVGRGQAHQQDEQVRTDDICWITNDSPAGKQWLEWASGLQTHLNRRLFLGLFSFESHFARYQPGDFYQRHLDSFRGQANRVLSMVVYLNKDWSPDDGGQLVLYQGESDTTGIRVTPEMGTVVVFLSEEFPHEVLPADRERYSIAGWFRINTSSDSRVDPPR